MRTADFVSRESVSKTSVARRAGDATVSARQKVGQQEL